MKLIMTTMAAIVLGASAAQAQQQNLCASWACNGCVYQNTQALGRAGDPPVLRLVREKQLRGAAQQQPCVRLSHAVPIMTGPDSERTLTGEASQ